MKFSQTVKLTKPDLVVTPRHEAWVVRNSHPSYSLAAVEFAHRALTDPPRLRKGTVSASSLGNCPRRQQFTYLGMPEVNPDAQGARRMLNGIFMHLRWQMEGLTEGWLTEAEVKVPSNMFALSGTMDGILCNGAVLELKSINTHGFSQVLTFGPQKEHLFQMATYMLASRRKLGVFIYEDKNTQDYLELPVGHEDVPMAEATEQALEIWDSTDREVLYEPLSKCIDQEGWRFASCPFRDRCLGIRTWQEAEELCV